MIFDIMYTNATFINHSCPVFYDDHDDKYTNVTFLKLFQDFGL